MSMVPVFPFRQFQLTRLLSKSSSAHNAEFSDHKTSAFHTATRRRYPLERRHLRRGESAMTPPPVPMCSRTHVFRAHQVESIAFLLEAAAVPVGVFDMRTHVTPTTCVRHLLCCEKQRAQSPQSPPPPPPSPPLLYPTDEPAHAASVYDLMHVALLSSSAGVGKSAVLVAHADMMKPEADMIARTRCWRIQTLVADSQSSFKSSLCSYLDRKFVLDGARTEDHDAVFSFSNVSTPKSLFHVRQGIQTTTENSCSQWPKRLTSKLTKNVGSWGAWELR
jgi:hypothetical protein